ncbi:MAG: hypothetical protein ACE147_14365 [Candidatus Methylomirabilales bacterium]
MQIAPCRTYHGKTVARARLRMPDGQSVFKVYYISVIDRDTPERFEWARGPRTPADFEAAFSRTGIRGIGFVIAFPHVTKVFRFSPSGETVLDVRELHTDGLRPMDCARPDSFHEFACYAEAVLAAAEFHAWARAATVEEYLAFDARDDDFPVISNSKLAAYWKE